MSCIIMYSFENQSSAIDYFLFSVVVLSLLHLPAEIMSPMANPIAISKFQLNEELFDLLFHTLYFLRSNTYYISFSDYSKYRAKVCT